jgi:hypothetical protein
VVRSAPDAGGGPVIKSVIAFAILILAAATGAFAFASEFLLDYAVFALVPIASALIWWSYLPQPAEALSKTFE